MFFNGLLVAAEQAGLGIELSDGGKVSLSELWRLKANVSKSAIMTFGKGSVEGRRQKWGGTRSAEGIKI